MSPVAAAIQRFILAELTPGRYVKSVGYEDDLLNLGIVDSHGIIELVSYLESEFEISIDDEDLTPENFASIASIERFLAGQTATDAGLG
ncbi:MAG TPA: acyl carrier protein [Solirubrobacteraceae bacterium]|nr:acyl carrier protein [Solirubrobacteraceae bacterium]